MATLPYIDTVISPSGGMNPYAGQGMDYNFTLSLPDASGGEVTISLTDQLTGLQTQIGFGNVTGIDPTFIYTFSNKVYALSGSTAYFSALDAPTVWNDPNAAGNGFITMTNYFSTNEPLVSIAPYQGRLLFISRRLVQVWATDPDPALYALIQTLPNIGTFAPLSVQPVGDMDVYMLYDSGIRSVRVRDASNNALIADIGTPIDAIIVPLLAQLTDVQKAASCGIVDPSLNSYWLYIPNSDGSAGLIYVFSYFPSSQIAAWGTFSPTYQSAIASPAANYVNGVVTYTGLTVGQRYAWLPGANEVSLTCGTTTLAKSQSLTGEGAFVATATTATVTGSGLAVSFTGALSLTVSFVPTKFVVFNGQVYARAGDSLYLYGGSDNQTYDNCGVSWTIPYLSADTPGTRKFFSAVDAALEGTWSVGFSSDYNTNIYSPVFNSTLSTFQLGRIQVNRWATHMSLQGVESGSGYARFSNALCYYSEGEQKAQP